MASPQHAVPIVLLVSILSCTCESKICAAGDDTSNGLHYACDMPSDTHPICCDLALAMRTCSPKDLQCQSTVLRKHLRDFAGVSGFKFWMAWGPTYVASFAMSFCPTLSEEIASQACKSMASFCHIQWESATLHQKFDCHVPGVKPVCCDLIGQTSTCTSKGLACFTCGIGGLACSKHGKDHDGKMVDFAKNFLHHVVPHSDLATCTLADSACYTQAFVSLTSEFIKAGFDFSKMVNPMYLGSFCPTLYRMKEWNISYVKKELGCTRESSSVAASNGVHASPEDTHRKPHRETITGTEVASEPVDSVSTTFSVLYQ